VASTWGRFGAGRGLHTRLIPRLRQVDMALRQFCNDGNLK
jgi:hypothetical protein